MLFSRVASFLPTTGALAPARRSLTSSSIPRDASDVKVTWNGRVVTFTLSRPSLNKISPPMLEMLKQKLLNLTDPAWLAANGFNGRNPIGALIITGAGDRAFSAGADLDAIKKMDEVGIKKTLLLTRWINNILEKSRFPTIAAFNGITFGLGLELGLACRLRYACEEALLALPETRVGLIPGAGGTIRLPRLIGEGRAQEMIMTGNPMCAMRAYETGLVNRVFTTETLLPEVEAIAQKIAQTSPDAIDYANAAILAGRKGEDAGLYQEAKLFEDLSQNLATRQTISSFLKKDKG